MNEESSESLLSAANELQAELAVINDELSLFLLSYIYNTGLSSITHRDLARDLGWDVRDIISRCFDLTKLGVLVGEYVASEVSGAVWLSPKGNALLHRLGFQENLELSADSWATIKAKFIQREAEWKSSLLSLRKERKPVLQVLNEPIWLYLLTYVDNTAPPPLTYWDLSQDLGWDFATVDKACQDLASIGMVSLLPEDDINNFVILTSLGKSTLNSFGFTDRPILSVTPNRIPWIEAKPEMLRKLGITYDKVVLRAEIIFQDDVAIVKLSVNGEGLSENIGNILEKLVDSGLRKVVVDFQYFKLVGSSLSQHAQIQLQLLEFLLDVQSHLAKYQGRLVLAGVSETLKDVINSEQRLYRLNAYDTEGEAIQALLDPPMKNSLGSSQ